MKERNVDTFEFFDAINAVQDTLFGDLAHDQILILGFYSAAGDDADFTETEAILPIAEYRRLKRMEESHAELLERLQGWVSIYGGCICDFGPEGTLCNICRTRQTIAKATRHQQEGD